MSHQGPSFQPYVHVHVVLSLSLLRPLFHPGRRAGGVPRKKNLGVLKIVVSTPTAPLVMAGGRRGPCFVLFVFLLVSSAQLSTPTAPQPAGRRILFSFSFFNVACQLSSAQHPHSTHVFPPCFFVVFACQLSSAPHSSTPGGRRGPPPPPFFSFFLSSLLSTPQSKNRSQGPASGPLNTPHPHPLPESPPPGSLRYNQTLNFHHLGPVA